MNKYYMIPNSKEIDSFKEELILPLKDFSIGFNVYFDADEIKEISKNKVVNVIINRFMHKDDLQNIKSIIDVIKPYVNLFFIEDLGLLSLLEKDKIVLYQNHIVNNYDSVNYFKELGINNIVINSDLTIEEIEEIREKVSSNLFIFGINKIALMYSRRLLLSSFDKYKNIDSEKTKTIIEKVSKKPLIITEEEYGTTIFNSKVFSINKYLNRLNDFNIIINFSNLNEEETEKVMKHYKNEGINNMLEVDDYFLDNKIIYKVGDIK